MLKDKRFNFFFFFFLSLNVKATLGSNLWVEREKKCNTHYTYRQQTPAATYDKMTTFVKVIVRPGHP